MYRYLFFDADGTLFDFDQAEYNAFRNMETSLGLGFSDEHAKLYNHCNQGCWQEFEKGLLTLENLKVERFKRFAAEVHLDLDAKLLSKTYETELSHQGILFEHSIEVLETLRSRGYTLFLASNGISNIQRGRIQVSNIGKYFKHIFISEELGFQKPDQRYFTYMFEKTGLMERKFETLMIGDSLSSDIAGSGMDTLWLNLGGKQSTPLIHPTYTHTTLLSILDRLTGSL